MDRKLVVGICAFGLVVVAIFSAWTFAGSGENQRRDALAAQLSTAYPAERPLTETFGNSTSRQRRQRLTLLRG